MAEWRKIVMRILVLTALCVALPGCALVGPKTVNGSFACTAPTGTCAPTLTIDDRAIRKIREQARAGNAVVVPGSVSILEAGQGRSAKIVFPAYFDAMGRLHEQTVVHTKFNDGLAAGAFDIPPVSSSSSSSKIDLVSYASGRDSAGSYSVAPQASKPVPSQPVSAAGPEISSPDVFPVPGTE
jgi:conjugal transfer pilus assembly protein TraV